MAYADRQGLVPEVANALWRVVSLMDAAERNWRLEEINRAREGGAGV